MNTADVTSLISELHAEQLKAEAAGLDKCVAVTVIMTMVGQDDELVTHAYVRGDFDAAQASIQHIAEASHLLAAHRGEKAYS